MRLGALIAVLSLAAPLPILAQGTLAEHYDTSKRVSFAGTVDAIIMPPGELPVCFLMTIQNSGKSEQWVVAGDTFPALRKSGMASRPSRAGEAGRIGEPSVLLPKPGTIAAQTLGARRRETLPTGIRGPLADAPLKAGRLAQGVEVKLADGQKLTFGPPEAGCGRHAARPTRCTARADSTVSRLSEWSSEHREHPADNAVLGQRCRCPWGPWTCVGCPATARPDGLPHHVTTDSPQSGLMSEGTGTSNAARRTRPRPRP